jgi:hypothetical protein
MPWTCFSYPADVPPGIGRRDVTQSDPSGPSGPHRMVTTHCFSYPADLSPVTATNGAAEAAPPCPRRTNSTCFSY